MIPARRKAPSILEGDCLAFIDKARAASGKPFDLVYVDPPFNAGGRRGARIGDGERIHGATAYEDSWGGIDAFLSMLEPRLAAVRAAMSETGSLWLHLDHRAVHDTKVVADSVFGRRAFRGEIIWVPGNGARSKKGPSVTHQTILVYANGRDMIWNADDEALREPFAETSMKMHFRNVDAEGRAYRERIIAGKSYRYYADRGRRLGSVWTDCPAMNANTPLTRETTGYPTQKPETLLERIIRAATHDASAVLDPMCGSGTTVVVAARLGRPAIGIDVSPLACRVARGRLAALQKTA
jgi:site-specific DNA-methyltransferase (adenine-specific)